MTIIWVDRQKQRHIDKAQLVHMKLVTIDMGNAQREVIGNWQLKNALCRQKVHNYNACSFQGPIFQNQIENCNKTKMADNILFRGKSYLEAKISHLLCCWSQHCLEAPEQNDIQYVTVNI